MDLVHKVKLFNKCLGYQMPLKQDLVLSQQFLNKKNNTQVTLQLTQDDIIIMTTIKQKLLICRLQPHVKFVVRQEKLSINTEENLNLQSFLLHFEADDMKPIHLQSNSLDTLLWLEKLRKKVCLLDYQYFYELDKLIGQGSFGSVLKLKIQKVYTAKRKTDGLQFAAKAFNKKMLFATDSKGRIQIDNEIAIMKQLNHINLINLHEVFENKAQVYLILDLAKGGSLEQAIKLLSGSIPYLAAKIIFRQILEGVNYMHELNIMHRDLKPANILFKNNIPLKKYGLNQLEPNVLISDFGIASEVKDRLNVYQYCGSPGYMAPEVFDCLQTPSKTYNEMCDVFSLGCIFYYMLTGRQLFQGITQEAIKKVNHLCQIDFGQMQKDFNMSTSLTLLLQKMLSKSPDQRPKIKEILNSKILQVEYTEEGVPVFKNFNRPTSSPIKRHSAIYNYDQKMNVLSLSDIPEEKEDRKSLRKIRKHNTQEEIDQQQQYQTQTVKSKAHEVFKSQRNCALPVLNQQKAYVQSLNDIPEEEKKDQLKKSRLVKVGQSQEINKQSTDQLRQRKVSDIIKTQSQKLLEAKCSINNKK